MIRIENLVKHYGDGNARVEALRGVTLAVKEGEMLMLMGPSGSGKTTLLSIMGCILRATSGSVRIQGRRRRGWRSRSFRRCGGRTSGSSFRGSISFRR